MLTVRAVRWATDALSHDDTTVSALARHLGVAWHTVMDAVACWVVTPNDRTRWLMTFVESSTACPSPQKTC